MEKSLTEKLLEIVNAVKKIPKTGYNNYHKYHYVQESDLLEVVKTELIKQGIYLTTSITSISRTDHAKGDGKFDHLTTIQAEYTFVDVKSGEKIAICGAGEGADSLDKGVYKANTGAFKYFLMRNFLISTGDDPERDGQSPQSKPEPVHEPAPDAPQEIAGKVEEKVKQQTTKKDGTAMKDTLYRIKVKGMDFTTFRKEYAERAEKCRTEDRDVSISYITKNGKYRNITELVEGVQF